MKSQLAEEELDLYTTTQHIAEEHRAELLRVAEAWRLTHPVQIHGMKRTRWWNRLLPWGRAPIRPGRSLITPVDRLRCESTNAPDTAQTESFRSSLMTIKRGSPPLNPDAKFVPGTFEEEGDLAWHDDVAAIAKTSAAGHRPSDSRCRPADHEEDP